MADNSSWLSNAGSGDFYDGSNWNNGIPPGGSSGPNTDIATFGTSTNETISFGNATSDLHIGEFAISDNYTFNTDSNDSNYFFEGAGIQVGAGSATFNVNTGVAVQFSNSSTVTGTQFNLSVSGAELFFMDTSNGSASTSVVLSGGVQNGGSVNAETTVPGGLVLGSIEGAGNTFTISCDLTLGGNNLDKSLATQIAPIGNLTFTKVGTGTLTYTQGSSNNLSVTISDGAIQLGDGTSVNGNFNGTITNNATLIFNHSGAFTRSALIQGTGVVEKIGSSTLTLSYNNTYSGGTTLAAGTLIAGNNSAFGTNTVSVTGNAAIQSSANGRTLANAFSIGTGNTLTISGTNGLTLSGNLTGLGALTHSNTGTTVLNGTNTYSGATSITAGTFQVGDASHSSASIASNVTVHTGGTLSGHGTVNGNVSSVGGTVVPGGSIGTMVVTGNYTSDSNTTLQIEVSPSAASLLQVTGSATLTGGTLSLIFDAGIYSATSYNILTATPVTGEFITVNTSNLPSGFSSSIQYLTNAIKLILSQGGSNKQNLAQRATTSLGVTVGSFLDEVNNDSPTSQQQQLINELNNITNNNFLNADLEQLAPIINGPIQALTLGQQHQELIKKRFNKLNLTNFYAAGDNDPTYGLWLTPFFEGGKQNNKGTLLGYRANTTGVLLGFEKDNNKGLTLGIAASYAWSSVKSINYANTYTNIKTYLASLYGTYTLSHNLHLDLLGTGGYNSYNGQRIINVAPTYAAAASNYNGQQYSAAAIIRKDYFYKKIHVSPQINANYVYLHQNGYSETGAGTLDYTVNSTNSNVATLGTGFQASKPIKEGRRTFITQIQALVYYDVKSAAQNVTSSFITGGPTMLTSATPGRLTGQIGANLTFNIYRRLSFEINYDLFIKNRYYNNSAFINFTYCF